MKTTIYSMPCRAFMLTIVIAVSTVILTVSGCSDSGADKSASGSATPNGAGVASPVAPEVKAQMDQSRQADAARHAALAEKMNAPKK
ncbi:MAG: hypothetical protein H8F28_14330 [Fibrella sp.]|nr:hypothetical protein [Armatimonadota bacterium]